MQCLFATFATLNFLFFDFERVKNQNVTSETILEVALLFQLVLKYYCFCFLNYFLLSFNTVLCRLSQIMRHQFIMNHVVFQRGIFYEKFSQMAEN